MKKLLCMIPVLLAFMACVGLETETTFKPDGSGTMSFTYRISNMLAEMGEDGNDVDLPINETTLRESLTDADGVTLKSVSSWSDETDTYISATMNFESIQTFYEQEEYDDMAASLTKDGGDFVYKQLISEGNGSNGEMTDAEKAEMESANAMMAPYFEGYEVKIIIHTPRRIKDANMGDISDGGKTLTYTVPMMDIQNMTKETYLIVRW